MRFLITLILFLSIISCNDSSKEIRTSGNENDTLEAFIPDTSNIPQDKFGEMVRYGRELMLRTSFYIGPEGINGKYLGNKMNCSHCHQDAGTKPYSFNLVKSHDRYPMYRAREGKVLSLAERVNNCITHPHSGKPLPLDSKEMLAFLSWMKWINAPVSKQKYMRGEKNSYVNLSS